jgi:hypothetical protein
VFPHALEGTVQPIKTIGVQDTPDQDTPDCPMCSGESFLLGQLGALIWLRCCRCGIHFSISSQQVCFPVEGQRKLQRQSS